MEFRQLIAKDKNEILRKDTYAKIISKVTRKYVLDNNVFPINNDCYEHFEIGTDMPHRLQLINIICKKYLTIRMYSYCNKLNKDLNPVSKRQKLSKLILFNNM